MRQGNFTGDTRSSSSSRTMANVPRLFSVQMVVDSVLIFALCGPLLALNMLGMPVTTGFWCHDTSISLPYKPDSISKPLLLIMGFGGPFLVIVLTETFRAFLGNKKMSPLKMQLMNIAKAYGVFVFGMAADCIFTEMLKYSVGRLRPHFMDVCRPNFDQTNCSSVIWPKVRSNIFRHREPDIYPSEDRTAFLLNPPKACADINHYDAVMVVHSATSHFKNRMDYRQTYGNPDFTMPYKLKLLFFLGLPTDALVQAELIIEHQRHQDTVQANFVDTYHNLSYKAVAVLRWLTEQCPDSPMVVKMDDDVLLDVHRLFEAALETPILWVDDVYIYGIVRRKTQDVQVLFLDQVSYSEDKYNTCVRQYGYRFLNITSPQEGDLRLLGPLSSQGTGGGARTCERRVPADLMADLMQIFCYNIKPEPTLKLGARSSDLEGRQVTVAGEASGRTVSWFVEDYECTNKLVDPKLLRDSRLSFPSGHASVSVYSALFTVFYLQLRMELGFSYLLRPLVQLCLMLLATFCCVSRITDHKHFVSDIAAGAAMGSILAWLTFYKIGMRVIPETIPAVKPRVLPRAVSVESEPRTPTPLLKPASYVQVQRSDFADKV
ncbi:phospholipid phosphatase 1 [Plakobranchus ocellatus]|uniref:Phospholipid phosphatase 1 n=1 Tax=Plakobranchus ocellatus TaxID=259542 RepID=A0AAV4BI30_9GAST|nr:phospholipid phosphatase 1 [Plakobranchus ocellatus]